MVFLLIVTAGLLFLGAWMILSAVLCNDRSFMGRSGLDQIQKWRSKSRSIWDQPSMRDLTNFVSRFVYLDQIAQETLKRQLFHAGMLLSPEQFTARKYVVLGAGIAVAALCACMNFWPGILMAGLITVYGMMKLRESLMSRVQAKEEAVAQEMPRFVRTLCRSLQTGRDIYAALSSYRKVAGHALAPELDILLAHMRTGGVASALQQFQNRLGTDEAFRLCGALQEIDRGIDQSAALEYLADDMAVQAKLNIQKTLSTRPAKMRRTYLPAVGVCVAMIIYVLVVFVMDQLNTLF